MGLSFRALSSTYSPTPIDNVFVQYPQLDKVFAFWLERYFKIIWNIEKTHCIKRICSALKRDLGKTLGGELTIGGVDPTYFTGSFLNTKVTSGYFWEFKFDE